MMFVLGATLLLLLVGVYFFASRKAAIDQAQASSIRIAEGIAHSMDLLLIEKGTVAATIANTPILTEALLQSNSDYAMLGAPKRQEYIDDLYSLRKPTVDGRTELVLTPLELLDRLSKLITPPRVHKHRYCGVLAPNAKLRKAVIETAGPSGATLQLLTEAREKMEIDQPDQSQDKPQGRARMAAARCWAMLLARIYECLPLACPRCGEPMRLIAFILEPPVVEKILLHIGEPTEPPAVLPARAPPQMDMDFDQVAEVSDWPDMDQTAGAEDETWN